MIPPTNSLDRAKALLQGMKGVLRTRDILRLRIHPRTLYALRDSGAVEQVSRGVYRTASAEPLANPDLCTVAARAPKGVVCLISALAFHEMTTQIPHQVWLALERGSRPPKISHPPLRVLWFTGPAFTEGIENHTIDGVTVRIYSPEKTLADCFKYRRKIGIDVAVEALRLYRRNRKPDVKGVLHLARICRVERVMRPYLESLL